MLRPSLIVDTVVSTLQTIPALVTAMANDPTRIVGHHFIQGVTKTLTETINQMVQPSLLVAYAGAMGGDFDGQTIFKHHVDVYYRAGNQANVITPLAGEDIWYLIINQPVNGSDVQYLNIRNIQLLPAQLDLMDTPSYQHMTDEQGQDFFVGKMILPEIGDQP